MQNLFNRPHRTSTPHTLAATRAHQGVASDGGALYFTLSIYGMTCGACEKTVRTALQQVAPSSSLTVLAVPSVDAASGRATVLVSCGIDDQACGGSGGSSSRELEAGTAVVAAIEKVGFDVHVTSVQALSNGAAAAVLAGAVNEGAVSSGSTRASAATG
jgi:copper chaperone CopZ